jgi:hypothetical protein
MNIVLIIGLLLAFVTGFFVALKSMQIGLRWNIQIANKQEPELHSPIAPIVEVVQTTAQQKAVEKVNKFTSEQLDSINPFL